MVAWLRVGLAAAVLFAAASTAGASPYQASAGPGVSPGMGAAPDSNASVPVDPYDRSDFGNRQSFGLAATQMLGAAAACEQLHSDHISLGQPARAARGTSDNRADLDAAQQHMLDPAVAASGSGAYADCDRLSGSFARLQEIQMQNQALAKDLDQPDAMSPANGKAGPAR